MLFERRSGELNFAVRQSVNVVDRNAVSVVEPSINEYASAEGITAAGFSSSPGPCGRLYGNPSG